MKDEKVMALMAIDTQEAGLGVLLLAIDGR